MSVGADPIPGLRKSPLKVYYGLLAKIFDMRQETGCLDVLVKLFVKGLGKFV